MYQTHIANIGKLKHRLVQLWAEQDPRHIAVATGQRGCHHNACVKAQVRGDILNNICIEFTCSSPVYPLNSWPV